MRRLQRPTVTWLLVQFCCLVAYTSGQRYEITQTWNGLDVFLGSVDVEFSVSEANNLEIRISAPLFNSPDITEEEDLCKPGYPYKALYNFEVVEVFLLASKTEEYIELEFSPQGCHYNLLLHPVRTSLVEYLPLEYTTILNQGSWSGRAVVPADYLPVGVDKFNIHAIHGNVDGLEDDLQWTDGKIYESLFPAKGSQPDFHDLATYGEINFTLPELTPSSSLWSAARQNPTQIYYTLEENVEVWIDSNFTEQAFNIRARVRQETPFDNIGCGNIHSDDEENELSQDDQRGIHIYLYGEEFRYLQIIMGIPGPDYIPVEGETNCDSLTLLWGPKNVVYQRKGVVGYSETYDNENGWWTGEFIISWAYLPRNLEAIQIKRKLSDNDSEFLFKFGDDLDQLIHNETTAGLLNSVHVVDPDYNSEDSGLWEENTKPDSTIAIVVGSVMGVSMIIVTSALLYFRYAH